MSSLEELLKQADSVTATQKKFHEELKKRYKQQQIFRMSEEEFSFAEITRFSSGDLGLDIALGGGWPRGRMHKLSGKFSAGKTKILASAIAELTMRHKERVLIIDVEGRITKDWLLCQGVDVTRVFVARPATAEIALDILESAVETGEYSCIILDSIAAMSPEDEVEASHEDWQRGLLSRLVNKFCRKLTARMNRVAISGEAIPTIFITNQIRASMDQYNPEFTPGGTQQDNTATIICDLHRVEDFWSGPKEQAREERDYIGWFTRVHTRKNNVAPPLKTTRVGILNQPFLGHPAYSFYHGDVIHRFSLRLGLITQAGSWYEMPAMGLKVQGERAMHQAIMENFELRSVLVEAIKGHLSSIPIQYDANLLQPIEPGEHVENVA